MGDDPSFEPPEITDEDIRWASRLLGLCPDDAFFGKDRTDPRQEVLKCMGSIDVAACPGSGKTTLLVAKLAILSEKWRYHTRGICVLSHTNAARKEIERWLGGTTAGRRLLAYPHFVGTIHTFVDKYLAMPWLGARGYPIRMVDTQTCERRRWFTLDRRWRSSLQRQGLDESSFRICDTSFNLSAKRGTLPFAASTDTYKHLRTACEQVAKQGYHCFDDMFIWAAELMDRVPSIVEMVRSRFPILFIDEAQDNSEDQSAILNRVFFCGDGPVRRQRFGDANQAIFNSTEAEGATTDLFPNDQFKKELPNSHRFGQQIASLAGPLAVHQHCGGLRGFGPKKLSCSSSEPEGRHTLFLFNDQDIGTVMDAYGELLLRSFSEQELRKGTFTVVGQVHRPKTEEEKHKFPRHVGHYWHHYDPEMAKADPKPQTFLQYAAAGTMAAELAGEAHFAVEKVAEGVLRLAGMGVGGAARSHRRYCHRYVLQLLRGSSREAAWYKVLISRLAASRKALSKEGWDARWRSVVRKVAEAIAGVSLSGVEAGAFLAWADPPSLAAAPTPDTRTKPTNIYRYSRDGKQVCVRVGSIHSAKGQTHTATLVLETFWYDPNLHKLRSWILGEMVGWKRGDGVQQKTRLKLHYVAMTRPTHLLCLAMKRGTFEDPSGGLDHAAMLKLKERGWHLIDLTDQTTGWAAFNPR